MAQFQKDFYQDLNQDVKIRQCGTIVFTGDNESNIITVSLFNGQTPAPQTGSVACYVIRSDGKTVPTIAGTIDGNTVSVTLTEACFTRPGPIGVGIQVIDGTVKTTVLKAVYNVETLYTDDVIDPSGEITLSVGDLVQRIDTAVASIPADYSDLLAAIAPDYTDLTYPVTAGTWCWHNGVLHRATVDIPSSETWTAAHWETAPLSNALAGNIADLKSAFDDFVGEVVSASPAVDWEQGQFNTSTGVKTDAVTRIRTVSTGVPQNVKFIEAINGYKFLIYAWSASAYLGIWDGTGFNNTSASGLVKTKEDLRNVYNAGAEIIQIVLMRPNASESIVPSEGVNLIYTLYENDIPLIKNRVSALENFDDTIKTSYQRGNLYQAKIDDVDNRYYYRNSSGVLSVGVNTNYIGFIVPVIPNHTYAFTRSRILLLKQDKTLVHTTGGNYDYAGVTKCYSESASYFAVSVERVDIPETGYVMSMGDALDDSDYELGIYSNPTPEEYKISHKSLSGSLSDGQEYIISGRCGIRDGYYAAFLGKFSNFNTLTLKFNGVNVTNRVTVTADNLVIVGGIGGIITQPHGLTISNAVQVLLELKNSIMYVTIASGGIKYTYNCPWYWTGSRASELSVTASGMSFTYAKISVNFKSAERKIWYFGDSYAEFNMDSRLPYYVIEYGFDKNLLFNSISGASSALGTISIDTLLEYGTPKYAINALGMNDGSDSNDTTPNANWLTNVQSFIDICEHHNIIPVLCTIPTIPTVNNNGKNTWVKTSGYRYIDMAGAVGADGTGAWYTGMLGQDNIHPSPLGAVAQFMQLLADMPEIM